MIFPYTGINQGNDPQWQKLNYTRQSLVPSARQRQFSMELRGDLASGSTVWSEENCDREQRETETWKSAQLIENERVRLRNVLPKQLRFQEKWLPNAGNRACDNNKTKRCPICQTNYMFPGVFKCKHGENALLCNCVFLITSFANNFWS